MEVIELIRPEAMPAWDKFIDNHPYGWLCHLSGWKILLENTFPHIRGHFLALTDQKGDIVAGLPVYSVRSWLLGNRLVAVPYATLSDPLVGSREEFEPIINQCLELAKRLGCRSIEYRTFRSSAMTSDTRFTEDTSFKHHYLSLEQDPDAMLRSFDRTCVRQRLNRASKSGLHLVRVSDEKGIHRFYECYVRSRRFLGLPAQPLRFIHTLWNTYGPDGRVEIMLADMDDRTIAGVLLLKYRDRVSVEYSVHDERYRKVSPVHFLIWEAIQASCHAGYRIFDFGRTDTSNTSLMDFKRHWGTRIVDLPQFSYPRYNQRSPRSEGIRYSISRIVCRHAPMPLYSVLGDFFYRHLG